MSDDPWWPEGYANPAFTVQRQPFGSAMGGDYVRGSEVLTLPQTALRYPSTVPGFEDVQGKAYLAIRPWMRLPPVIYKGTTKDDYGSAQIAWGWPTGLEEKWTEVVLVRSGFGDPTTVNDGQAVFWSTKTGYLDDEGKIVLPPPVVIDQPLQSGHWYYYSLFFKTGPLDWVLGMTGNVQIPRDYRNSEHLWEGIPPFYQHTDANIREGNGFLQQMLSIFGYELDTVRQYIESWQECYHIDKTPMPLLKRVGENFGEAYKGGVGAIRYRSLIAALPEALSMRGTAQAMQQIIEASSKWLCDTTIGNNLMLLPDDSDFGKGTGNWATMHPDTDDLDTASSLPPVDVILTRNDPAFVAPPPSYGRASMRIRTLKAKETQPLCITCGSGVTVDKEIIPLYTGVTVNENDTYGFSFMVKMEVRSKVLPVIFWFDFEGRPIDLLSRTSGTETIPPTTGWTSYLVTGPAPQGAVYLVPGIVFNDRSTSAGGSTYSPYIDIAGASVYLLGSRSQVTIAPPDSYLTIGELTEIIGDKQAPGAPGEFESDYLMGSPTNLPPVTP